MFQRWFYGRYGMDPFSMFMAFLALLFIVSRNWIFMILGLLIVAYVLFRAFSRNIDQRRKELYAFNRVTRNIAYGTARLINRVRPFFTGVSRSFKTRSMKWRQRKEYRFVRCPRCKKTLRLPRNKGKIIVTCPMCRYEFRKKT